MPNHSEIGDTFKVRAGLLPIFLTEPCSFDAVRETVRVVPAAFNSQKHIEFGPRNSSQGQEPDMQNKKEASIFETGLMGILPPAQHRLLARSGNLLDLRALWISWQTRMPITLKFHAPSQHGHDHPP